MLAQSIVSADLKTYYQTQAILRVLTKEIVFIYEDV